MATILPREGQYFIPSVYVLGRKQLLALKALYLSSQKSHFHIIFFTDRPVCPVKCSFHHFLVVVALRIVSYHESCCQKHPPAV